MNNVQEININNLKKLMDCYEISIKQLAKKISVSENTIKSWFNKTCAPTYPQLIKISESFKKPVIFFFMNNPKIEAAEYNFRMSQGFELVENKKRIAELIGIGLAYRASLKDMFTAELKESCLSKLVDFYTNTREKFNDELRNYLEFDIDKQTQFGRPTEVIEYLREKFFNQGIYVFKESFRLENVSGFCIYDDKFPIIMLNNTVSFTRQLFTLFHELYHLISKKSHIELLNFSEKECDRFAGEFLIPDINIKIDVDLYKRTGKRTCEDEAFIKRMAQKYNVSYEAYCYRLLNIGEVSDTFYNDYSLMLKQNVLRTGQDDIAGGNYYFTKMNYVGKTYLDNVVARFLAGKIPLRYVAQYTQMKVPHVKKMLFMMAGGRY